MSAEQLPPQLARVLTPFAIRCMIRTVEYLTDGDVSARLDLQVEHVRLGIPMSSPLAVQQWDGLIAVNYEARKFGVKRGDRTDAAKQKCPQIMLVHVETISVDPMHGTGDEAGKVREPPDKSACKVSLERWGLEHGFG